MAPLLQELGELEVEPLEVTVSEPEPSQDSRLNTLTTTLGDAGVVAILTGTLPVAICCCCCCSDQPSCGTFCQ